MWNCPKCDESIHDNFAVCWQCGTDRNGREEPDFGLQPDNGNTVMELDETEPPLRWQINLWCFFLLVSCAALIVGLIRGIPAVVVLALICIVIANLFGLIVGLFVTHVLGFPNDGSLTRRQFGSASRWAAQVIATDADNKEKNTDVELPLCLNCIRPVSPLDHYCPHCGQSVGQLTPYLPYEGIWFNAGMWGKLWDRLWYKNVDTVARKCFFFFLILIGTPILLLALPTVWWWKSRENQRT
jgi:hypothetical protein